MQRRKFLTTALVAPAAVASAEPTDGSTKPFVVKNGKARFGEKTNVGGSVDIKISGKDTANQLTVFEYLGVVKGGPPLHVHPHQDEIFIILDGRYKFQVGSETHELTVGDTIFLPRNVPHTFAQLTDGGKMLYFFTPSGKMEDFFRTLGDLKTTPTPEQGAKIFEAHDMKVVGPPLPLE